MRLAVCLLDRRPSSPLLITRPGALATAGVLLGGLRSFATGSRERSQMFMRARVFAQGFTVLAVAATVLYIRPQAKAAEEAAKASDKL